MYSDDSNLKAEGKWKSFLVILWYYFCSQIRLPRYTRISSTRQLFIFELFNFRKGASYEGKENNRFNRRFTDCLLYSTGQFYFWSRSLQKPGSML